MIPRLYFPFYCRGSNRNCSFQLIIRYIITRHILCCSTLPLCSIYRSSIWTIRWCNFLIPSIHRPHSPPYMVKNPFLPNIYWCKRHIFPSAFPRAERDTTSLLRLPWYLYNLKCSFFHRLPYFFHCHSPIYFYPMRSFRCSAALTPTTNSNSCVRMTTTATRPISHLPRNPFRYRCSPTKKPIPAHPLDIF